MSREHFDAKAEHAPAKSAAEMLADLANKKPVLNEYEQALADAKRPTVSLDEKARRVAEATSSLADARALKTSATDAVAATWGTRSR